MRREISRARHHRAETIAAHRGNILTVAAQVDLGVLLLKRRHVLSPLLVCGLSHSSKAGSVLWLGLVKVDSHLPLNPYLWAAF